MSLRLPRPGLYRHYKGDTYQLLCVMRRKDAWGDKPLLDKGAFPQGAEVESPEGFQVCYYNIDVGCPWDQPLAEFLSPVWVEDDEGAGEGRFVPRFTLIETTDSIFPTL